VLALGVGTTTMVGICVGAGLVDRARRVTFVSCVLAVAIFGTAGFGRCGVWKLDRREFTHVEEVVLAASGYFRVTGFIWLCRRYCFPLIRDGEGQRFRC
jgi:hypothetical protein